MNLKQTIDMMVENFTVGHGHMSHEDLQKWAKEAASTGFTMYGPGKHKIKFIKDFGKHLAGDVITVDTFSESNKDIGCFTKKGKRKSIPKDVFVLKESTIGFNSNRKITSVPIRIDLSDFKQVFGADISEFQAQNIAQKIVTQYLEDVKRSDSKPNNGASVTKPLNQYDTNLSQPLL